MDENMPELSGVEATREIRRYEAQQRRTPVPIIAMTANAFLEDRNRLLDNGMTDYISKPVTPEKLLSLLECYLPAKGEQG
jgi:CheY-like chemotaxis protein